MRPFRAMIVVMTAMSQAGLYLAFTDNLGWRELIAAGIAGGIAATAAVVFARAGKLQFAFRLRDVMQGWRLPWYIMKGSAQVLLALARQLFTRDGAASFVAAVRYDMGAKDDRADAGRRALVITYTTSTPNFIIFGLVDRQELLLYHQIVPGPVGVMTQKLGARP